MQGDGSTKASNTYGTQIAPSIYHPERSLIQTPSVSEAGNTIIRVGREWRAGSESWHQTEHVVLTPAETDGFLDELVQQRCARLALEVAELDDDERAEKFRQVADNLTTVVIGALRGGDDAPDAPDDPMTAERAAAERAVALQLLSGRRSLYVGGGAR